ncbi:hypothetical protein Q5P01_003186 [Channa striata]|uniref:Uncharacterized protein n=1 Tax=Channa striata TaxID=64152 RepID=A0AA88NJ50_CHASR|nr:hypothetical protein Q5P01_003186 [Channa striata]
MSRGVSPGQKPRRFPRIRNSGHSNNLSPTEADSLSLTRRRNRPTQTPKHHRPFTAPPVSPWAPWSRRGQPGRTFPTYFSIGGCSRAPVSRSVRNPPPLRTPASSVRQNRPLPAAAFTGSLRSESSQRASDPHTSTLNMRRGSHRRESPPPSRILIREHGSSSVEEHSHLPRLRVIVPSFFLWTHLLPGTPLDFVKVGAPDV